MPNIKRLKKSTKKSTKAYKAQKKIYDALRYQKKKLTKLIEEIGKRFKSIYEHDTRNSLNDYDKADIENLYKKAVFEKDKDAKEELLKLGKEYKGGMKDFTRTWTDTLQQDLQDNIYGTRTSKLKSAVKRDLENFKALMNGLTEEQKLEFLNSSSYYGARRYQKPPAESESFNIQIKQEGKSYIVDNLLKYYKDKGLPIPADYVKLATKK